MLISFAIGVVLTGLALVAYRTMIGVKPTLQLPTTTQSASLQLRDLEERLRMHVTVLAEQIGERNVERPAALQAAEDYIRRVWSGQGFSVRDEAFEAWGRRCVNLIVELRGASRPEEIVLVGAHYDTAPGTPGANDNGSGVAVLLEMSRMLKSSTPARTIRLVAFTNEEPPSFFSDRMGSRVHARGARRRGENIVAMLSLETIGYYSNSPGSQSYPVPFSFFYPSTGNFLTVVGNLTSRSLVVTFLRRFMEATDFPVEGVATFSWIPGVNWSDHWSFWQEDYPAIMLTDTAPFRYPAYHSPGDLPARIAWPEFTRASRGIIAAVRRLAEER